MSCKHSTAFQSHNNQTQSRQPAQWFSGELNSATTRDGALQCSRQSPVFASKLTGRDATLLQVHPPTAAETLIGLAIP
jgi:hypothetical protein